MVKWGVLLVKQGQMGQFVSRKFYEILNVIHGSVNAFKVVLFFEGVLKKFQSILGKFQVCFKGDSRGV